MKEFFYNGEKFTTSDNVLKIHNLAIPIQKYFTDELRKQLDGLDIKPIEEDRKKIESFKIKIQENENYLSGIKDKKEISRVEKINKQLKSELVKLTSAFNANEKYKEVLSEYEIRTQRAFEMLITEDYLIRPFLEKYLSGDTSKLDYTDINILTFISEVMTDFFLTISQNKKKLKR